MISSRSSGQSSFVGQLNLIPVRLVNPSERLVSFDGQVVRVGRFAEQFSAEKPRLAVRPEELNPGHAPGENNLQGKIESINYLGSIVRLRVEMGGMLFSMDIFMDIFERNLVLPRVGDRYDLHFPVDACWLI
ncbi:MAG TPA: TOBE domain-containing protein [Anaerolineaceae bacterium]|nr:TOBE domain-containing protein [Anaerolineaceae bacterium]